MRLHSFHNRPEILEVSAKQAFCCVPALFWDPIDGRYTLLRDEELARRAPAIALSSWHAMTYALHIIKGRFREGESVLAKNPLRAAIYAVYALGSRFYEAEDVILCHEEARRIYVNHFPECAERAAAES